MLSGKRMVYVSLTAICLGLGLLLVIQLRTQRASRQPGNGEDWESVVAELIEGNGRLRDEIESLELQLTELQDIEGGGALLESLVDEVNRLRIANGLLEVSGPGVELEISGWVSVLDLHDLLNELRNAGAEALALNGQRIVAWTAIGTDGENVTVDGRPVQLPYRLVAIGSAHTMDAALARPGGLIDSLHQARPGVSVTVSQREKLTLPVFDQPLRFVYAEPAE